MEWISRGKSAEEYQPPRDEKSARIPINTEKSAGECQQRSAILHNLARTYKQRKRQISRDTSADTAGSEEESSRGTSADFYLRSQHGCISRKSSDI